MAESSLEEALAGADGESPDLPAITARDVSCLLYTSGTTGRSKGVVLTHGANLRLARANLELMEYEPDDVLYTAFPLFHVNAKFTSVVSAMISGARLVLDRRFSASRFWETMRREGVTSFNYLGGMLAILASQPAGRGRSPPQRQPGLRRRLPAGPLGSPSKSASGCSCSSTTG